MGLIFRPYRIEPQEPVEREFRVFFSDLEFNWHMTNSRYVAMLDLMRIEKTVRAGFWEVAKRNGWRPMLRTSYIRYRKEFRRGDRFTIRVEMAYVSTTWFYLEYSFVKDGVVHCQALEKVGFHKRGAGMVSPIDLAREAGHELTVGEPPAYVAKWIEAEEELRQVTRRGS